MGVMVKQVTIVAQDALKSGQLAGKMALFDTEGVPVNLAGATTTAADAPDGDNDSTIANTKFVLKNAGKNKTELAALTAVAAANGAAAAGAAPTKAEYDVLVTLANANKVAINAIIAALKA